MRRASQLVEQQPRPVARPREGHRELRGGSAGIPPESSPARSSRSPGPKSRREPTTPQAEPHDRVLRPRAESRWPAPLTVRRCNRRTSIASRRSGGRLPLFCNVGRDGHQSGQDRPCESRRNRADRMAATPACREPGRRCRQAGCALFVRRAVRGRRLRINVSSDRRPFRRREDPEPRRRPPPILRPRPRRPRWTPHGFDSSRSTICAKTAGPL